MSFFQVYRCNKLKYFLLLLIKKYQILLYQKDHPFFKTMGRIHVPQPFQIIWSSAISSQLTYKVSFEGPSVKLMKLLSASFDIISDTRNVQSLPGPFFFLANQALEVFKANVSHFMVATCTWSQIVVMYHSAMVWYNLMYHCRMIYILTPWSMRQQFTFLHHLPTRKGKLLPKSNPNSCFYLGKIGSYVILIYLVPIISS